MTTEPWLDNYAPGVDWHAALEPTTMPAMLAEACERYGDRPAMDFLGRRWCYGDLASMVERATRGFQEIGIGPGKTVGLFLPNCPQFIIAYHAALAAGARVVNYSPLYAEAELRHQIEDSETDVMVTLDLGALYPKMAGLLQSTRLERLVVGSLADVLPFPKNKLFPLVKRKEIAAVAWDAGAMRFTELMRNEGRPAPVEISPQDVAVLQYTGGTTGVSKGAMLSHANLTVNVRQTALWLPDRRLGEERMMGVLPFFHVFAMTVVMNLSLHIGAEIVMHPRFVLEDVMRDIPRKKPTLMPGVPTMFRAIADHKDAARLDLSSIRACMSGGAPLPVETKRRFEALTGAVVFEGYGLTEAAPCCSCNPVQGENRPGSIGQPMPGTRITVTDPEDPDREMPRGEAGEIRVEGPQVMLGYWKRPEATAEALGGGRLRTGDVGYIDDDGYIHIIDRIKDLILVGGFNVYPRHVEDAIHGHEDVAEVTVIGIPDDYAGERVKAFVKPRAGAGLDEATLLAFLQDKLGRHELPKEIEFRDDLPKTMIGKLSKKELVAEEMAKRGGVA